MKIFYKKDFQRVLEEKKKLENEFSDYKERSDESISALNSKCFEQLNEITNLNNQLDKQNEVKKLNEELSIKLRKANSSKGGFTKQINKLEEEIKELSAKIKEKDELLSKRYILKKISSGRTPNTIKTSIKNSANESRAIKYVKERL